MTEERGLPPQRRLPLGGCRPAAPTRHPASEPTTARAATTAARTIGRATVAAAGESSWAGVPLVAGLAATATAIGVGLALGEGVGCGAVGLGVGTGLGLSAGLGVAVGAGGAGFAVATGAAFAGIGWIET